MSLKDKIRGWFGIGLALTIMAVFFNAIVCFIKFLVVGGPHSANISLLIIVAVLIVIAILMFRNRC